MKTDSDFLTVLSSEDGLQNEGETMKRKDRRQEAIDRFFVQKQKEAQNIAWRQQIEQTRELNKTVRGTCDHVFTRREALRASLAFATVPTLLSAITTRAFAIDPAACQPENAGDSAGPVDPSYLHIELYGGASIAGNMVFGKQAAGSPLELHAAEGYGTNRWGEGVRPQQVTLDVRFGAPFHPQSPLLAGILSVLSPEAQAKVRAAGIASVSGDDNGNNNHNPIQFISKMRSSGALTALAVERDSNSGGLSAAMNIGDDPSIPKAIVESEASVANLVDPGLIASRLNKEAAIKIAEAAAKLTESKLAAFNKKDLNSQVQELIACGYLQSKDLLSEYTVDRITPSADTVFTSTPFGNLSYAQRITDSDNQRVLVMSKLLTDGLAAAATTTIGSALTNAARPYDYHGQGTDRQMTMDTAAGVKIGLALEVAHRKGRPMMIAVTTDGSVSANDGNGIRAFTADSGSRSAALIFAIGATSAPATIQNQIGKFSDSGAVDTSYLEVVSNSANLMALNIAYNYAAFAGKMAQFSALLTETGNQNPFNEADYLAFEPKA